MIRLIVNCIVTTLRAFSIGFLSFMLTTAVMDYMFCSNIRYNPPKKNILHLVDFPEDYFDNWTHQEKLDWVNQFSCVNNGFDLCYQVRRAAYDRAVNYTREMLVNKQRAEKHRAEVNARFAEYERQQLEYKRKMEEFKAEKEANMWQSYLSYEKDGITCNTWHYLILGLDVGASKADIKKAYRVRALQYHPDKVCQTQKDCEETTRKFKAITNARDVLLNV